jgi:hypothetical protein
MGIFAKQGGTWSTGNSPAGNQIYAKQNGTWYGAISVWAKQGGSWSSAGITSRPNSPQLAGAGTPQQWGSIIGSAADNFGQVGLGYWGPSGGPAPTGYIHRMYNSSYQLLQQIGPGDTGYAAGNCTFNVSPNTAYVFRVYSVNAAGESAGYLEARYAIGHAQQTYQQANWGWGAEYDVGPNIFDWTSNAAGHEHYYAGDYPGNNCWGTSFLGAGRYGANNVDGVRMYPRNVDYNGTAVPGDALCRGVRVWPSYGKRIWVGIQNQANSSPGQTTNYWYNGTDAMNQASYNPSGPWVDSEAYNKFAHMYCHVTGVGVPLNQEHHYRPYDEGIDIRRGNMTVDVLIDQLDYVGGIGYTGGFVEIIFRFQSWTIVSYTTVTSVNQQNNYYW